LHETAGGICWLLAEGLLEKHQFRKVPPIPDLGGKLSTSPVWCLFRASYTPLSLIKYVLIPFVGGITVPAYAASKHGVMGLVSATIVLSDHINPDDPYIAVRLKLFQMNGARKASMLTGMFPLIFIYLDEYECLFVVSELHPGTLLQRFVVPLHEKIIS
jgi:hypothetical protein